MSLVEPDRDDLDAHGKDLNMLSKWFLCSAPLAAPLPIAPNELGVLVPDICLSRPGAGVSIVAAGGGAPMSFSMPSKLA
jgi:hypothetical protein